MRLASASRAFGLIAAVALGATGCGGITYTIRHDELVRLAEQAPVQRAQSVRVVQDLLGDREMPGINPGIYMVPMLAYDPGCSGGAFYVAGADGAAAMISCRSTIGVGGGVHMGMGGGIGGPNPSGGGGGGSGGSGGGGGGGGGGAGGDKGAAIVLVVAAAVLAVGLAVTEGARYDGDVRLHPLHPLHLYGPDGSYRQVPLALLDPATAAWADEAEVRETDGPYFQTIGRAPLDRHGFVYTLDFGAGGIGRYDGTVDTGYLSHIQFGFFPIHELGINASLALGWTDGNVNVAFTARYGLELQVYPLSYGVLHAGAFAQGGLSYRSEDVYDATDGSEHTFTRHDYYYGGGLLAQLELSTRLALTLRGGFNLLHETGPDPVAGEATLGLSIY